jgi:hypothetical protein
MQVRMMTQCLIPRMQHRQKADICTEVARVCGDRAQRLRRGGE